MPLEKGKEIETSRLRFRQFDADDIDAYVAIMGDSAVGNEFPKGTGYTREESKKSLDNIMNHWGKHGLESGR